MRTHFPFPSISSSLVVSSSSLAPSLSRAAPLPPLLRLRCPERPRRMAAAEAELWPWVGYSMYSIRHSLSGDELRTLRSLLSSQSAADVRQLMAEDIHYGMLPLHAVARDADKKGEYALPFFEAVFNAHPKAAEAEDCGGNLPLHYVALRWFSSPAEGLRAMQMLLNAHPKAAEAKDSDGDLPLHYVALWWCGGAPSEAAVRLLLSLAPHAAAERNNDGELPLHRLCDNLDSPSVAMAELLLSANPAALAAKDDEGRTPCQVAAVNERLPAAVLSYLQRAEAGERQQRGGRAMRGRGRGRGEKERWRQREEGMRKRETASEKREKGILEEDTFFSEQ